MIVKRLSDLKEIIALDDTRIKEFFNPKHSDNELHLGYSLAHATLKPGTSSLPHKFKSASEVYYILQGKGIMHINEEEEEVVSGDVVYIPPKAIQYIDSVGTEDLEFLCIVYPEWEPLAEELV